MIRSRKRDIRRDPVRKPDRRAPSQRIGVTTLLVGTKIGEDGKQYFQIQHTYTHDDLAKHGEKHMRQIMGKADAQGNTVKDVTRIGRVVHVVYVRERA